MVRYAHSLSPSLFISLSLCLYSSPSPPPLSPLSPLPLPPIISFSTCLSVYSWDHDNKEDYEFYPGSGKDDIVCANCINVPIAPLWRKSGSKAGSSTRRQTQTAYSTYRGFGRSEFRRQIETRLLPPLRAFNPDLILISAGFDGTKDDVGNCRHTASGNRSQMQGLDLEPEDFHWATEKIVEVANMCCNGRVVSVLEGGYGRMCGATTRGSAKASASAGKGSAKGGAANRRVTGKPIDLNYPDSSAAGGGAGGGGNMLDRSTLADSAVMHLAGLVDHRRRSLVNEEEGTDM